MSGPAMASSSAAMRSVRVSCQTMALWCGRPVWRSQMTVVSRWLVRPMAARSRARRPWRPRAVWMTAQLRSQISTGLCSTQPGRGRICWCSSWWPATTVPVWSKTRNRVLVVPWSRAPMKSVISSPRSGLAAPSQERPLPNLGTATAADNGGRSTMSNDFRVPWCGARSDSVGRTCRRDHGVGGAGAVRDRGQ